MRIFISPTKAGNVLLIMLVTIVIIGITLTSYLNLVSNQNLSTMRSQQWNSAISLAEAGIEEALTHLHHNPTNRERNGWTLVDTNYVKEREIDQNKYVVTISIDTPPIIISKAYVRVPLQTNYIDPPRTIRVGTTNDALFAKGMVAKGQIDLSGNNIKTDSFDSSDPNYSTDGKYDDDKAKDNGDVATNLAVVDSLNVWNAEIWGTASTGPGGTVRIGANGAVGDRAWHEAGNKGIQPGRATDDMNVNFPDVQPPFTGGAFLPLPGVVGGTNYTYVVGNGNYQMPFLSMSGGDQMLVNGHAVLYVEGEVSLAGNAKIRIAPGASLQLFVGGPRASFGGNGIVNEGARAQDFYYFGLNSNTSITMTGNASFTGAIYAPYAALQLGGGGNNTYDFVGASVTGSVKLNGKYNFHYDENLAAVGPRRGFTVISWNEINWSSWSEI